MKIIYCLAGTFNSGGMERIVVAKANWLAKRGYGICIVTTEQNGRTDFFTLNSSIKRIDLDIMYSENVTPNPLKKYFVRKKKMKIHRKLMQDVINVENPDIIISTFGNEVEFLPQIKDESKKIVEIHFSRWFRLQFNRKGIWKFIDRFLTYKDCKTIKKYDKFICLTNEDRKNWGNLPNIAVIPNFIDHISKKPAKLVNKSLIAVGRLTYQKGYDYMIKAWKIISQYYPQWKLNIYGDGDLHEYLTNLIIKMNLSNSVKINKPISNIEEEYANHSGLILSSNYEGLPMVILEAMSNGLPVVSFACQCGPRDIIINDYNGLLVGKGDINSLAYAIQNLISSKEKRLKLGFNSWLSANEYLESKIMPLWENLFNNLLKTDISH